MGKRTGVSENTSSRNENPFTMRKMENKNATFMHKLNLKTLNAAQLSELHKLAVSVPLFFLSLSTEKKKPEKQAFLAFVRNQVLVRKVKEKERKTEVRK